MKRKNKPWNWPFQRINLGGAKEYACPHGVGHGGLHGCDGCCEKIPGFPGSVKEKPKIGEKCGKKLKKHMIHRIV